MLYARNLACARALGPGLGGDSQSPRRLGAQRHHAVRARPALFAHSGHAIAAADLVHADRMERSVVRAADRQWLDVAFGDGVGTDECGAIVAVSRFASGRGDQAGLSRRCRQARTEAPYSVIGAGAGATAAATAAALKFNWQLLADDIATVLCRSLPLGERSARAAA